MMDGKWFRLQHHQAGVSQAEAARRMGKAPTFFTRVYEGRQQLRLSEAQQLARILGLALSDVLSHAGLSVTPDEAIEPARPRGFEEADVAPLQGMPMEGPIKPVPQGPGQSAWAVRTDDLALAGYRKGDRILVDLNARPRKGDVVIAQIYDWGTGDAQTILRIFQPPYLVRPSLAAETPLAVDGERIIIKGVVLAQWRERPHD